VGVIGGSGLYDMPDLAGREERRIDTPFGAPSDAFVLGELEGVGCAFLARHGRGHRLLPSELNFRANLWAFKSLGVERLLSVSAVGSMKEAYRPGHLVVPDQFFDRTRQRPGTFFGRGLVAHVSLARPVCPDLAGRFVAAGREAGATVHDGGTYLCIEGPQFSTRAESEIFRRWGVDVIGMTNLPEARLAREAELCYATLALVTDYDCWHDEEEVSGEAILEVLGRNVAMARQVIRRVVAGLVGAAPRSCACADALRQALITPIDAVPHETLEALAPIVARLRSASPPEGDV